LFSKKGLRVYLGTKMYYNILTFYTGKVTKNVHIFVAQDPDPYTDPKNPDPEPTRSVSDQKSLVRSDSDPDPQPE
jgi:hypothetical protein